jgi:hypothetical protein
MTVLFRLESSGILDEYPKPRRSAGHLQAGFRRSIGSLRCLVQFVVILDPSKTASRLIGGRPGEATELG